MQTKEQGEILKVKKLVHEVSQEVHTLILKKIKENSELLQTHQGNWLLYSRVILSLYSAHFAMALEICDADVKKVEVENAKPK